MADGTTTEREKTPFKSGSDEAKRDEKGIVNSVDSTEWQSELQSNSARGTAGSEFIYMNRLRERAETERI